MSRTHARLALTLTTTTLLVAMTALPALAADGGTKPDPDANPFLIGTVGELIVAAVLGAIIGTAAMLMRPSGPAESEDH